MKLPPATRIYVIADIHGRVDLLRILLRAIQKEADHHVASHHMLVTLGDYIDRGPDSRAVLELLSHEPLKGFARHCLKGNHEAMLLNFMKDPLQGGLWLQNGGEATLMSYGIDVAKQRSVDSVEDWLTTVRDMALKAIPAGHWQFLKALPSHYQLGEYYFVHGGVRPKVPLNQQNEEDLLWIRQEFLESNRDFGKIVVHGHTIVKEPEVRHNRIALDTGAFHTGKLTCLVLSREDCFFLQATSDEGV